MPSTVSACIKTSYIVRANTQSQREHSKSERTLRVRGNTQSQREHSESEGTPRVKANTQSQSEHSESEGTLKVRGNTQSQRERETLRRFFLVNTCVYFLTSEAINHRFTLVTIHTDLTEPKTAVEFLATGLAMRSQTD